MQDSLSINPTPYLFRETQEIRTRSRLDDVFPRIVCINLDRRPDRWRRFQEWVAFLNTGNVVRFSAIDGNRVLCPPHWNDSPGAYGCLLSHLEIVRRARHDGVPSILILEDDVAFDAQFEKRFEDCIVQVPADWDMLLFGGLQGGAPIAVHKNVIKIEHTLSTFAYALKHTIYDRFIELNEQALAAVDESNRILQKECNCYCFMPHLAWVEEDYSDIRGETENLWWIKESMALWSPEVDGLMSRTAMIIVHRGECISAKRVVEFLARYYSESLPEIDIVIVEQDAHSALEREMLPHSCGYRFQFNPGPINRARAFKAGFDIFKGSKDFFLFMDSNLLLTTEDVRANVRKCLEYDFVTSFDRVAELSGEDAEQIMNDDIRWDARSTRNLMVRQSICESCFVITAEGMTIVEGWIEASGTNITDNPKAFISSGGGWSEENLAAAVTRSLKVFESPNRARRLLSSRGRGIKTRSGHRAAWECS